MKHMKEISIRVLKKMLVAIMALPGLTGHAYAQSSGMTPEQREAYMNKIRSASEADWQRTMSLLQLSQPTLPPAADDPKRPAGLIQRAGSNNWHDSAGYTYVRSGWGNWSNYDESN